MAKTLYVYLKGGRGDAHVTDLWNGAVPEEEGAFNHDAGIGEDPMSAAGREVGEPYRDIHNYSTTVRAVLPGGLPKDPLEESTPTLPRVSAGDVVLNGTALKVNGATPSLLNGGVYAPDGFAAEGYVTGTTPGLVGVSGTAAMVLTDLTPQVSDEVANTKPRLFTKVCTWLIFKETGVPTPTAIFKFRKADVLGWGCNPRSE